MTDKPDGAYAEVLEYRKGAIYGKERSDYRNR